MLTILPFETAFYQKFDYPVEYVGNPVLDAVNQFHSAPQTETGFRQQNHLGERPLIALLAGSRSQEIKLMLPTMLEISRYFPQHQFVIAGAPGIEPEFYQKFIGGHDVPVIFDQTYHLLKHSKAALVTSGTATLETALIGTPQAVCYSTNIGDILYRIGRKLIHVPWISLVNLILNREVVKELVQFTFKKEYLIAELDAMLNHAEYRQKMLDSYSELRQIMGNPGASGRAAKSIVAFMKS
jgi:lipid-A-disaccharide synthase